MLDRGDLPDFGKAEAWERLRSNRAMRARLDVDDLLIAAHLAGLYEAVTLTEATKAFRHEPERMVALAGEGAPVVSEYAASELSGHLRIPLHSARQLLGDAIEVAHRLPKLWALMVDGKTEAWRVGAVAKETRRLSMRAAAWVDAQISRGAQRRKPNNAAPQLVDEAIKRFDTELFATQEQRRLDGRGVWVDHDKTQGLVRQVSMNLDAPDAELFDRVIDDLAAIGKACGDTDDHQARRAKAVGTLLDPQLTLDLLNGTLPDQQGSKAPGTPSRVANVYVHCTLDDLATMTDQGTDTGTDHGTDHGADLERLGPITLDRLSEWLTRPGGIASAKIQVRPVIDTNTDAAVDQHDPPEWMRQAMILRDPTCVFPGCTISARSSDADHIVPYIPLDEGGPPGQTCLANLAPLCRSHHRLKTHRGWDYRRRTDGTYAWTDRWGRAVRDDRDLDSARSTGSRVEFHLHDFLVEYAGDGPDPPT